MIGSTIPASFAYGRAERNIRPVAISTLRPEACAAPIASFVRWRMTASSAISVPVEVADDDVDVERKIAWKLDQPEVDWTTYAAMSAICCSDS